MRLRLKLRLEQDEKYAKNQELKIVIQETRDKKYKEAEVLKNERIAEKFKKNLNELSQRTIQGVRSK